MKTSQKHPGLINVIKVRGGNCDHILEQRTHSDLSDDPELTREETVLYSTFCEFVLKLELSTSASASSENQLYFPTKRNKCI